MQTLNERKQREKKHWHVSVQRTTNHNGPPTLPVRGVSSRGGGWSPSASSKLPLAAWALSLSPRDCFARRSPSGGEKKFLVKTPLLSLVMEPSSWRGAAERTSENFQGVQVKVLVRRFWSQCLGRNVPALNLWLHCLLSIETGDKMDMLAHLFAGILFVPSNGAPLECDFCGT